MDTTDTVKVLKCNDGAHSQDAIHGQGMRVHNRTKKTQGNEYVYRCTVCGKEKTAK